MPAIEVQNLKKYFGKIHALDDVSFSVDEGEVFGFLGPNGAGKTTTIRCLMNFIKPTSGDIKIFGLDAQKKSTIVKNHLGYLSGDVRLYDNWTGRDHILFLEKLRKKRSIARDLIVKLNFDPHIKFKNLSSGNKQKLGLILALMFEPKLMIMDEPTLGLDPLLQNAIYKILDELKKKGSTIFISSHNLIEVERICDRVGIIKDGKIVAIESIESLIEKRIHTARVRFNGQFSKDAFNIDGMEVQQELSDGLILGIHGNINLLIKKLSEYDIKELEISHASLEEIFLEYYGGVGRSAQKQNKFEEDKSVLITQNDLNEVPKLKE
ncbi:MAG: transporter-like protein, antibiotic transport system ATP-binding protein [Candidatus Berkelbacteria bacterium]|nr:transporter-like protein, antibiotic transport system ATP-binding protein [Candidatus Berkelbacteria bacterium]